MFTGLIEHLGTVTRITRDSGGCTLVIGDAAPILGDCAVGDSIAVNGACLTVTAFDAGTFTVWLANETLGRTELGACASMCFNLLDIIYASGTGERKEGDQVNLERAMGTHVRFGGHFVQVLCIAYTLHAPLNKHEYCRRTSTQRPPSLPATRTATPCASHSSSPSPRPSGRPSSRT